MPFLNLIRKFVYILCAMLLPQLVMYASGQTDNEVLCRPDVKYYMRRLEKEMDYKYGDTVVFISVAYQQMYVISGSVILKRYSISTAKKGIGSVVNSGQTPLGIHKVTEKFGNKSKLPYIYSSRVNTKKKAKLIKEPKDTKYDVVTSRILWLDGQEENVNCGGDVDSHNRFIYIHGTAEEGLVGSAASDGCIRMLNKDVIQLYALVPLYAYVVIIDDAATENVVGY